MRSWIPHRIQIGVAILAVVLVGLAGWAVVGSIDAAGSLADYLAGETTVSLSPQAPTARPTVEQPVTAFLRSAFVPLVGTGLLAAVGLAVVSANRIKSRRAREARLNTWELRLGRDDITNPFKVQEAFEGIAGSLATRWYQRLWQGQSHLALEVHRRPDGLVVFTVAGPVEVEPAMRAALKELYPDVRLERREGRPGWTDTVIRLKKARPYVLSIQTVSAYEHAFSESLVAGLDTAVGPTSVQLVLTPAPRLLHSRSRVLLKRRERNLNHRDRRDEFDPGARSVVDAKELQGALETQHRSLLYFDLRVFAERGDDAARVAGLFAQLRSDNELVRRDMRLRRRLYAARAVRALPNLFPGTRTGVLSTSELATLWQLPRARVKEVRLNRSTVRRAIAPHEISRDPEHQLMRDERGPVGLATTDQKYGHALIGGQGGGKSSVMARSFRMKATYGTGAIVLFDPKGPLAELALGLIPAERKVHYLDLANPEIGFNPLLVSGSPGARASLLVQAIIEANPPGAIQAASDSFLRQAIAAVCAVEAAPTLWHVYRMFDLNPRAPYRQWVADRLSQTPGTDFARNYWRREFPALLGSSGFAAQALNPPRNKIERLISTPEMDTLLRHPVTLDLGEVIERGEVLVVRGAKATVGEDNAIFAMQLLLQLLHRALQGQQARPSTERRGVSLYIDEAHNLLTRTVATMLAEGRSAGLDATFAWQYSAQIADQVTRSGLRSLLQSLSIFRMREMDDARSIAGLAMEVYSDRISVGVEEQERLRFSADDIVKLPIHQAINLWIAEGVPRPGFVAQTLPMEELHDDRQAEHHRVAQRERGAYRPDFLPDPFAQMATIAQRAAKVPAVDPASAGDGAVGQSEGAKRVRPSPARRAKPRSSKPAKTITVRVDREPAVVEADPPGAEREPRSQEPTVGVDAAEARVPAAVAPTVDDLEELD